MAHIAERMATHYLGAVNGYQVTACPTLDLLILYLHEARPNFFFGVPAPGRSSRRRRWRQSPTTRRRSASSTARWPPPGPWFWLGWNESSLVPNGTPSPHSIAVFRPVRDLLGLDALELAVVGAAPVGVEVIEWFLTIGVPLSETYGMSETAAGLTWSPTPSVRARWAGHCRACRSGSGTTGRSSPRAGTSSRYLDDPDLTAETLDDDGWLHTGDIGELDEDGYLRIVDRKKELIVSAGGENVSPANLEAAPRASLVAHACAIGDRRPFVAALVVLDPDVAQAWAKERGIAVSSSTSWPTIRPCDPRSKPAPTPS